MESSEERKETKNMNILSILASDNYIVINRDLLKKYGINVTLMLCELASEYNYFDKSGKLEDGMFYSTIDNISERTGLSKYQQAEALKALDEDGIVKSVIKGIPAKRYFKIDVEELTKQIANISLSSCKEIRKQAGEKCCNGLLHHISFHCPSSCFMCNLDTSPFPYLCLGRAGIFHYVSYVHVHFFGQNGKECREKE